MPYEGIWAAEGFGYYTVQENSGQIIIVGLPNDVNTSNWEAYTAVVNGNSFRAETLIGDVRGVVNGKFISDTVAEITQESCYPVVKGYYCLFPNGHKTTLHKVF